MKRADLLVLVFAVVASGCATMPQGAVFVDRQHVPAFAQDGYAWRCDKTETNVTGAIVCHPFTVNGRVMMRPVADLMTETQR